MQNHVSRRGFLGTVGTGAASLAAASALSAETAPNEEPRKIVALACSPRKGKTTAQALGICLEAAKAVDPDRIEVELVELAGLSIPTYVVAGIPLESGDRDDFPKVAAKLMDANLAAVIIGTPVYFAGMTALCKALIDRMGALRRDNFALSGKVGAALAVGGVRSGGQELAIQGIQAALYCQEMLVVGDGRPTGHFGARLWNTGNDDIRGDEFGVATARNLGRRVAEAALGIDSTWNSP